MHSLRFSVTIAVCERRIMAITSAFQADDAGSIPVARSKNCNMNITVAVQENDAVVALCDGARVIAVGDVVPVRDVSAQLFGVIDSLCEGAGVSRDDIERITVTSPLSNSAITQRALRTVERVVEHERNRTRRSS